MKEIVETLKKRISENKNSMLVTVVAVQSREKQVPIW